MGLLDKLRLATPAIFGKVAEQEAERLLKSMGYKIIERNYHCRGGELDIVAMDGSVTVFCEVKARRSKTFGTALEAVTAAKVKKLRIAAEHYMTKKKLHGTDCRFDVVAIDMVDGQPSIEVIKNAF